MRTYTPAQGLPQHQVLTLDQDSRGFLWVGTLTGGLGRYDGKRWETFDASSGLPGSGIHDVAMDGTGGLLAATTGGVVSLTSTGWVTLEPARGKVTALLPEPASLLLGTSTGLLRRRTPLGATTPVETAGSLRGAAITQLVRALDGGVWVGTAQGLGHLAPEGQFLDFVPGLSAAKVLAILERPGRPLLASLDAIGLFEGTPGSFHRVGDDRVPGRRVAALQAVRDDPDDLWIGTGDRGAYRYVNRAFVPFGSAQGLIDDHVNAILEDREGVLWFGTDGGLTKRGPSAFLTLDDSDGFPAGQAVFGMAESADGSIWFSVWDKGLVRLGPQGAVRRFTTRDGLPPGDEVMDVAAHPEGGVVVVTRRELLRIQGDRVSLLPKPTGFPESATGLQVLPDGRMVLESTTGVFVGSPRQGFVRLPESAGLDVHGLSPLPDGTLWFGGDDGAFGFRPGHPGVTHLRREQGLPSNHVTDVFQDSQGRFWIGTDAGVFRRDPDGRVSTLGRREGLPDLFIYFIGEDPDQAIWFGTNRGAVRLDATGVLRTFTTRDGLGSDECNEDGFFVDSHGRVWIGSAGVSRFLGPPRPLRAADPPVWIERVFLNGRSLPLSERPRLPNQPRAVTFRFVSPSFTDENAIRFSYRLTGLSEDWTEGEPGQSEVTYARMGAGDYQFEVVARTADGRVSGTPATFGFEVRPLWWRTLPAIAVALFLVVGGTILLIHLRERQLVAARRHLEHEVAARTDDLRLANERLAALAVTDELTGVANRRRLMERLEEAMAFARRRHTPLAVVLADLDYFKLVNDRLGHSAGDTVLRQVARAMEDVLRTEDLLGRYGGDEFMAVLPGTDATGAQDAAERLRRAVEEVDFGADVTALLAPRGLTISVGVAAFEPLVKDAAELVRRADAALYRSKEGGRNRVSEDEPAHRQTSGATTDVADDA